MKIAQIAEPSHAVPPIGDGPGEIVIDGLCRGLKTLGHDVVLFAASDSTCPVTRWPGFPQSRPNEPDNTAIAATYVMEVYKHLGEFDIVHDHTLLGILHSQAYPKLKMVTTSHGGFNEILNPFFEAISPRVTIVANSRAHAKEATVATVPIHHGIDLESFTFREHAENYLAFIGRMSPLKGVHVAIEVARRAGMPLRIAARVKQQSEIDYFDQVIKPMLGNDIEFVGEIGGKEKDEHIGKAAALINPVQWNEPFGLVNVEAMACGTPVIACRRGALPELIDEGVNGFLCDDPDQLVDATKRISEIDRMKCRSVAEQRFSFERMAVDYVELYQKLLNGEALW